MIEQAFIIHRDVLFFFNFPISLIICLISGRHLSIFLFTFLVHIFNRLLISMSWLSLLLKTRHSVFFQLISACFSNIYFSIPFEFCFNTVPSEYLLMLRLCNRNNRHLLASAHRDRRPFLLFHFSPLVTEMAVMARPAIQKSRAGVTAECG